MLHCAPQSYVSPVWGGCQSHGRHPDVLFLLLSPSDGCSNPQSTIARISSGFSRKSLKPVEWMPTYPFFTCSPLGAASVAWASSCVQRSGSAECQQADQLHCLESRVIACLFVVHQLLLGAIHRICHSEGLLEGLWLCGGSCRSLLLLHQTRLVPKRSAAVLRGPRCREVAAEAARRLQQRALQECRKEHLRVN